MTITDNIKKQLLDSEANAAATGSANNMGQQRLCITITGPQAKELFEKTLKPMLQTAEEAGRFDFILGAAMATKALIQCPELPFHVGLMTIIDEAHINLTGQINKGLSDLGEMAGITQSYVDWINAEVGRVKVERSETGAAAGDPTE